jgi:hypothetical protein
MTFRILWPNGSESVLTEQQLVEMAKMVRVACEILQGKVVITRAVTK